MIRANGEAIRQALAERSLESYKGFITDVIEQGSPTQDGGLLVSWEVLQVWKAIMRSNFREITIEEQEGFRLDADRTLEALDSVPLEVDELTERLAEYSHDAWSGWIRYEHSKGETYKEPGSLAVSFKLPPWAYERWRRQSGTPYADLPEAEKGSDRSEARRMIAIMQGLPDPEPMVYESKE